MNEWLKKGVDEKENAVFGVDYSSLLAQNDDDKSKAFDALAHTLKDVDFNFDVLAFNNQNDKAKAFDSLKNQNAMFLALNDESEQQRNQRAKANAKVREDIAVLNDDGASYDEKINAREGYYDYLLQFGGDKELIKAFKDEVVLPYYENAKKQLFSEAVPFGENEKALDFKKRVAYLDQKINDLKFNRPYKNAQFDGLSDDEIKKNLGQRKRSFTEVGEDILGALGHLITATPLFDTVFNPADDKSVEHAKLDTNLRALSLQANERGQKLKISDLSPQEQARAYMIGYASSDFDDKITDLANAFVRDEKTYNEFIQKGLDIILKEALIAQTEYEDLSDEQRQFLYEKAGVLNRGWDRLLKDDDEETLKQSYDVVRGGALMKIASDRAESIRNFSKTHNLAWLGANYVAGSDEAFDQEYQKFKDDLNGVALDLNFDGVDSTGQYFYKTDENGEIKYYKLNDGFFDNLGNIFKNNAGSLVGALGGIGAGLYLAKKGKVKMAGSTLGETGAAITGSLLGSGVGGASDYINYALRNGKDIDFNTLVTHATQEGLFSLVGDAAALGLSKLANTTASKGVFNTLIKTPSEKIVKGADTLIAKFPVAGALTSPVRNFFKGQNIQAAEELVMKNFTPEQRMDIQNALKELGGGININPSQKGQFVADFLTQKYGNDSPIAKTARDFADAINMKGFRERQSKLLQFVISDESGKNLGYVMEIAKTSPEVQRNLENMVKYSALQLENALKKLDLPSNQFKAVFKDFEKGTEKSFDEAMELIGEKIYPGSVYKTKVDKAPFDDFLKSMNDEKIYMGDAEKRFMKEVIEPLFDEKGVSFAQLNNIRKQLNSKFKDIQSPNFKDYLRGQVGKKLREAVDKGINDILKQNPKAYAQVKELYDTALKDYSAMKDIQTIIKKHNFYKQETDFADDLDKLLKFIIKGKGDEKTPNLERILGQLTPANRAVAEVNILKQILENTRVELAQQFGKNQTHTYFTRDFVDKIDELAKKGSVFKSKEAQEFIQLVKDWHTLNKNHADILYDLRPADVKNVRQGIATRIQGRLEQMRTNILMSNMFRLLDKIPFASGLWDKTQAGALRFHIKNALSNSVSIDDFKLKLLDKVEQGKFDNKTKQLLREIIGEADNAEKTLNEMQRVENEVLRMSDDELVKREMIANQEKSPQFGRDMFILGEENLSGDIVKRTLENNKRVAVNKLNPQKAQELGFKYPNDVRRTISADEIRHTLNNHGVNSNNVKKSGQPPVDETDIANYQKMSDNADETLKSFDNDGHLVEVSFKQVNGYYVVVEQVRNKNNEFSFKTMFKGRGNYKDSEAYTKTAEKAQTLSQGYEPSANSLAKSADESIIPNTTPKSQGKSQILTENIIDYIKNANKEQLENDLKSIEAKQAYNKQALDYYKQNFAENSQQEIDFIENQLLKDAEKQRLITQRLDELKSGENANKAFEFSTPKEPKSAFAMRKELREVLEPVFDKPLTNANDGRVAVISKKKSSKLSSSKAAEKSVENGFSEAQHFETAKHLPELYENAKFKDTMPDKNGDPNLSIHHYTADFMLDGEPAQAKITLKETIDGNFKGNRVYTIELEEVAPKIQQHGGAMGEQNAMSRKPAAVPTDTPTANPKEIIPNTTPKSQGEQKIADLVKQKADDNLKNALDLFNGDKKALDDYIKELEADKRNLVGDELTLKTDNGAEIRFITNNHKTLRLADENDFLISMQSEIATKRYRENFDKADEWLLKNDSDFKQKRQEMVALHKELDSLFNQLADKYKYDYEKYGFDDILQYKKDDKLVKKYKEIDKKYNKLNEEINARRNELIDKYEKEALNGGENADKKLEKEAQESKDTASSTLKTIKEYYESKLESANKFIKEHQAELKRLKTHHKHEAGLIITEYSANLAKAMKEKTAYKKELQKLTKIEPLLRTAEKRLNEFAKNPNTQDLKAIYKLKNQLLSVESDLKPAFLWNYDKEHRAMLNKVADMLDLAFESIRTAKKSLAVKQADPKALTPTQAFLDFVDETKRQIDYALSFGKDTTLKTLDEIAKDYANSTPHLNFIKRKKAEVEAYFKGDELAEIQKIKENLDIMSGKTQGEKMNLSDFLNDKGGVDYTNLEKLAIDLPSSLNYKKFLAQFDNDSKVIIKTPIKDLEVNPRYMFFHLTKDGDKKGKFKGNGKENRIYLSGGVLETLQSPLFVTQDTAGTYYFYKAFKNNKGLINLVSLTVPKNNSQMLYRTSYNGSNQRIRDLIKEHKLIYKAD